MDKKIQIRCEHEKLVPIDEIEQHPKNPNIHSEAQVSRLARLIEYQGFRHPIVVSNLSGKVVVGHGRLEAAKKLDMDSVPVDYQDFESEEQEYAHLVADNGIGEWSNLDRSMINKDAMDLGPDFELDMLGMDGFVVEPAEKYDPGCDEDETPPVPKDPISVPGDVYTLGRHKVLCQDSTNLDAVMEMFGEDRAGLVITDPPYNVDYTGKTKDALKIENDKMDDEGFYQFLRDAYATMYGVSLEGAPIYVFHADSMGHHFRQALLDVGYKLAQTCIWVKDSLVMGRQDYHWKHEPILYGWKPGKGHTWLTDRKQTTVWNFDRPKRNDVHPTMKPIELLEYPLNNSSAVGSLVFDPFGGSGSTLIACEKTNRKCYTVEMDPKYVDVIVSRYVEYTGKATVLRNGEEFEWKVEKS